MIEKLIFPYGKRKLEKLISSVQGRQMIPDSEELTACAINFELKKRKNLKEYVKEVEDIFVQAKNGGAKILVFPELFYITPLTASAFTKGFFKKPKKIKNELVHENISNEFVPLEKLRVAPNENVPKRIEKILLRLKKVNEFVETLLSELSKKYRMMTATGGGFEFFEGAMKNLQRLINEKGEAILTSQKTHPMEFELSLGIHYGDRVEVVQTECGNIALPICFDASFFEVFEMISEKGGNIALIGTANMEPYNEYLAKRGVELRANENPMYIVKSALVGHVFGNVMTGKAEILAPQYVTGKSVIARAKSFDKSELVFAKLNLEKLNGKSAYFSNEINDHSIKCYDI